MSKANTTIEHSRSFTREDLQLLLLAINIIRRFNADELAAIFENISGIKTRQGQQLRTTELLKKLEAI